MIRNDQCNKSLTKSRNQNISNNNINQIDSKETDNLLNMLHNTPPQQQSRSHNFHKQTTTSKSSFTNSQNIMSNHNNLNNMFANQQATTNEMSLYSPSSSASLLYHIYDQINVSPEHHHSQQMKAQQQQQQDRQYMASDVTNNYQHQQPFQSSQLNHNFIYNNNNNSPQISNDLFQNLSSANSTYISSQVTLHNTNTNKQHNQFNNNNNQEVPFLHPSNLRNINQTTTTATNPPSNLFITDVATINGNADNNYNTTRVISTRPLSSSGISSGGRSSSTKSSSNLVGLLEANNNNHLFAHGEHHTLHGATSGGANGYGNMIVGPASTASRKSGVATLHNSLTKPSSQHLFSNNGLHAPAHGANNGKFLKKLNKNARQFLNRYPALIKVILMLLLIAFAVTILIRVCMPPTTSANSVDRHHHSQQYAQSPDRKFIQPYLSSSAQSPSSSSSQDQYLFSSMPTITVNYESEQQLTKVNSDNLHDLKSQKKSPSPSPSAYEQQSTLAAPPGIPDSRLMQYQQQDDNDNEQLIIAQQLDLMTQRNQEHAAATIAQQQQQQQQHQFALSNLMQLEEFAWSEWSPWSSCVDKNGMCDSTRLHSRLRKCMSQLTGVPTDSSKCKQRFDLQDKDFEVTDCSRTCANAHHHQQKQPIGGHQQQHPTTQAIASPQHAARQGHASSMGDILLDDAPSKPTLVLPTHHGEQHQLQQASESQQQANVIDKPGKLQQMLLPNPPLVTPSLMSPNLFNPDQQQQQQQASLNLPPLTIPVADLQQQQISCSNCTSDEICLFLQTSRVPFCAKIKEQNDATGCGGWCRASNQVCQQMGSNAFKCVQDVSECLADEWRCHDTQCIPLSKRCDGHANCYDSSDERDCPVPSANPNAAALNRSSVISAAALVAVAAPSVVSPVDD